MSRSGMQYSVRRITYARPSRLAAVGGNGASRREDEGVERVGRTVLAYVRGGAVVAMARQVVRLSANPVLQEHLKMTRSRWCHRSLQGCPSWLVEWWSGPVTGEGEWKTT